MSQTRRHAHGAPPTPVPMSANCLPLIWMLLSSATCGVLGGDRSARPLDELYPRGKTFCFTFYSTLIDDSRYALAHGATAIGPFYGDQSKALAQAEQLNAKLIYKVRPPWVRGFNWDKDALPPDERIVEEVSKIVISVRDNPLIAMWDIEPEERRYWRKKEMRYLKLVTDTVRRLDPMKRPIYMYEPNHRTSKALAKTLIYQDLCAKGMYVNAVRDIETKDAPVTMRHNRIWARWSMEQELDAIAAVKANIHGRPEPVPWIVLHMAFDAPQEDRPRIRAECRHDAYMGLIMGGKGIQIFSGWRRRKGFRHDFQRYFDAYLSVATDLNGRRRLAPVFLFGTTVKGVSMQIVKGPKKLTLHYNGTHEYPPVTWTAKQYEGKIYLFMVNSAEESVVAEFRGLPSVEHQDLFAATSAPTPKGSLTVGLPSLAVKAYRFY